MFDDNDPGRGVRLATLRRAKPMTQEVLATAAGISAQTVRRAEAGKPLLPETVQALCAALGIDASALRTQMASETLGTEILLEAFHRPESEVARVTHVRPTAAALPNDSTRPTVRGSTLALAALLAAGCGLQFLAWWAPDLGGQDGMRYLQSGSQTALAAALALALVRRALRAHDRTSRFRGWALAGLGACLVALPPYLLCVGFNATASEVSRNLHEYVRVSQVIRLRSVAEPAWDPGEAKWQAQRMLYHVWGGTSPRLDTPGTYAAFERDRARCRDLFLHSDSYPHDRCDNDTRPFRDPAWSRFLKSFTGASLMPGDDDAPTTDAILNFPGFEAERNIFDAHSWTRNVEVGPSWLGWTGTESGFDLEPMLVEARALAAARRDGKGAPN